MARDDDDDPRPKKRPRDDDDFEPRRKKRRDEDEDAPRAKKKRPRDDFDDDDALPPRRAKSGQGGGGLGKLVPTKNGPALMAYYAGIFGLIPVLGFLLGPIAFILGLIGFVKAKKNPQSRGMGHAISGIVLGIIDVPLWIILWYAVFEKLTREH